MKLQDELGRGMCLFECMDVVKGKVRRVYIVVAADAESARRMLKQYSDDPCLDEPLCIGNVVVAPLEFTGGIAHVF